MSIEHSWITGLTIGKPRELSGITEDELNLEAHPIEVIEIERVTLEPIALLEVASMGLLG